ncbi:hypothetical protein [Microbulbifer sp. ANSA005]|uniref:hypothetical protein n=1 Tax=Microbulbifer sp. ANSA005 TaxID=3243362 RepID=UPI00404265C2
MNRRFYKSYAEGMEGEEGAFLYEVVDQLIVRQIYVIDGCHFWATPNAENNEVYFFTDQPEFPKGDIPRLEKEFDLVELTEEDFLKVWEIAQKENY